MPERFAKSLNHWLTTKARPISHQYCILSISPALGLVASEATDRYVRRLLLAINFISYIYPHRLSRPVKFAAALLSVATAIYGCGQKPAGTSAARTPRISKSLLVGTGDSLSDSKPGVGPLAKNARFVAKLAVALEPGVDSLVVWKVDNRCHEIFSGSAPASMDEFARRFLAALSGNSDEPSRTDKFWTAVAERASSCREPFGVVFATDGFTEGVDAEGHRRIAEAARRLAANPYLRAVRIVGAAPGTREQIRKDLAAVGAKLDFLDPTDDPSVVVDAVRAEARN